MQEGAAQIGYKYLEPILAACHKSSVSLIQMSTNVGVFICVSCWHVPLSSVNTIKNIFTNAYMHICGYVCMYIYYICMHLCKFRVFAWSNLHFYSALGVHNYFMLVALKNQWILPLFAASHILIGSWFIVAVR